jgi:hypothetical protein
MKHKVISKLIFVLALMFTFSGSVRASEVSGNLSSAGVNTTTNTTGGTSGSISGTVNSGGGVGGSVVTGNLGSGTVSGTVTGGSSSGGSGGGNGGRLFASAPPTGSILGASTNSQSLNSNFGGSISEDGNALQTGSVKEIPDNPNTALAVNGSLVSEAQASTSNPSAVTASVIDAQGFGYGFWFWIILLILLLIATTTYIYSRSRNKRENYKNLI